MLFYAIFLSILCANYLLVNYVLLSLSKLIYYVISSLLLAYISWQSTQFLWRFKWMPKRILNSEGKAVFITGCDTGFGNLLARRLAQAGYHVYAGCLFSNGNGANGLKQELPDNSLTIIPVDVTSDESVSSARVLVEKSLALRQLKLWSVINNAGILSSTEIEFGDMSSFITQMNVNCLGLVRATKSFLPLLRPSKGRVINMASLAGRFAIPGMVGYCMSKSAVISFSDGLRREMKKWDIDVICIEPHLFRTNLVNDRNHQSALQQAWQQTPEDIRQVYGDCYFHGYQALLEKALHTARPGINNVVDTMYAAVTHSSVSPYYRVLGPIERLRVWMFEYLWPTRVLDWLSYIGCVWVTGLPETLQQKYAKKIE